MGFPSIIAAHFSVSLSHTYTNTLLINHHYYPFCALPNVEQLFFWFVRFYTYLSNLIRTVVYQPSAPVFPSPVVLEWRYLEFLSEDFSHSLPPNCEIWGTSRGTSFEYKAHCGCDIIPALNIAYLTVRFSKNSCLSLYAPIFDFSCMYSFMNGKTSFLPYALLSLSVCLKHRWFSYRHRHRYSPVPINLHCFWNRVIFWSLLVYLKACSVDLFIYSPSSVSILPDLIYSRFYLEMFVISYLSFLIVMRIPSQFGNSFLRH